MEVFILKHNPKQKLSVTTRKLIIELKKTRTTLSYKRIAAIVKKRTGQNLKVLEISDFYRSFRGDSSPLINEIRRDRYLKEYKSED